MSSVPPPPVEDFYDSNGFVIKNRVCEYLNSLFGSESKTKRLRFKLPSLAVPAIFEQPTQNVSFNKDNLDPKIQPFILYYFFNEERPQPNNTYMGDLKKNHTLYEITRYSPRGISIAGSSKPIVIEKLYNTGRFVFIVPLPSSNQWMIFSRQSSTGFLSGKESYSWKTRIDSITSCFRLNYGYDSFVPLGFASSKFYSQYKALISPLKKTRTLNYSKRGFQT